MLDPSVVQGLLLAAGSPAAHSLILARGLGIPAVVMAGAEILDLAEGSLVGLDGTSGEIWVHPSAEQQQGILARRADWLKERQAAFELRHQPAFTRSGERINLFANINSLQEAAQAVENGADGVGLLRTELLYQDRQSPPGEMEQADHYQAIASVLAGRPLVIRVLDAGGDKPLPFLPVEPESNPFLGLRGIRLLLAHPHLLKTQLRAILYASAEHDIRVMLPMVAQLQEVISARKLLEEAKEELTREGITFNPNLPLGIMIETPAAALMAEELAHACDFFSIGSNDLAQYVMAADRTSSSVNSLADSFQPAVLRAIYQVIQSADHTATPVSLCGELAGDPLAAPLLAGMGLRTFSMRPAAIPEVKMALSRVDVIDAARSISETLKIESADGIRSACRKFYFNVSAG
jgi:phosphocarrier protein FPr